MPPTKTKARPVDEDERLVSKLEVLDRVGVTFPTIWKWMQIGKFPRGREVNGETMWVASELNHWIQPTTASIEGDPAVPNPKLAKGWGR